MRLLEFKVGYTATPDKRPDKLVPATVPGAVQLDWAKAHDWPEHYYGNNYRQYAWMEDVYWLYTADLDLRCDAGEKIWLCCKGIDYKYDILINSVVIYSYEGMYTPFELDLSGFPADSELEILIHPIPKSIAEPVGRHQADRSCKPPVSYGWDFHPRLVPLGIWDEIWTEIRSEVSVMDLKFEYRMSDDLSRADIAYKFTASPAINSFEVMLYDDSGDMVFSNKHVCDGPDHNGHFDVKGSLSDPKLWWPVGYGEQNMYTARVVVYGKDGVVNDSRDVRAGFRVSKLVMHDGAWDHPDKMPKGRSDSPALMWINGREIFCKGSNWVPPDIFYGTVGEDKYRKLLTLAKDANFNMIRVWGGGNVNKDVFYDICDELGLMVWQEFPLACNNYPDEDAYLKVLDAESVSIIKRIRNHPCLVLWCGGNELFNKWSGMTEQSFALRILNRNCYELDRFTPFISTSPLDGMAHGSYVFYDMETGEDIIELINRSDNTAYPEFACPSLAREEILAEIIPENERDSYFESDSWVSHHAFDAFTPTAWAMPEVIEHYFGKSDSLSVMIEHSRLLQAEGLKAIYEEARRKQPKTSMALNWCLDESWPVAAGTSIIDWKLEPKPAYYSVKQSLRNVLLSLRFRKFMWSPNENIEAEVWLLNDSSEDIDPGEIRVSIGQTGTVLLCRSLAERSGKRLPAVRIGTIGIGAGEFGEGIVSVKVTSDKHPEINSEYKVMIASVKIPKKMRKSKANLNE